MCRNNPNIPYDIPIYIYIPFILGITLVDGKTILLVIPKSGSFVSLFLLSSCPE